MRVERIMEQRKAGSPDTHDWVCVKTRQPLWYYGVNCSAVLILGQDKKYLHSTSVRMRFSQHIKQPRFKNGLP